MQGSVLEYSAETPPASPLRELMTLAVPTVLQMASYTVEQFIDIYMLSHMPGIGNAAATAAGASSFVAFTVVSFGFGVMMLVNAMVSQAFGAGRTRECGAYVWQGVWFALVYGVAVVPLMLAAPWIFHLMRQPESLIGMEVTYFNVMTAGVAIKLASMALGQFTLAVNRPNLVLLAAAAGMVGNVVVNWFLIYGNAGAPELGVAGAAWGTNTAFVIELAILCCFVFGPACRRTYGTLVARFDAAKFKELLRVGLPSGVQTLGDVAAWTIFFAVVMGLYGQNALAGSNYALQYMKMSFMPAFGLGMAVTALVGRYLGAGRPDLAEQRAHLGFRVACVYMIGCALAFIALRHQLLRAFTDDPEIIAYGVTVVWFSAAFQLFDAMFVIYSSALRGAKDTFWPMVVQVGLNWTIVVAGGLLAATYARGLGIAVPWTLGVIYCMILGSYLLLRFRRGKWKSAETPVPAGANADALAPA